MDQRAKAEHFEALHVPGDPVILFNAWDAGSARVVAEAGAKAIATGSWSVAAAFGYPDGEAIPIELAIANLRRIIAAVELPVTLDLERGYGGNAAELGRSVAAVIEAGAVGVNIEDSRAGGAGLVETAEQAERLRAARSAAEAAAMPFYLNARIDLFLRAPASDHDEALLDKALERAAAYLDAGGSGIFVPGLADERLIARFCERCPAPVNVMAAPGAPTAERLRALGVARISHGPWPYRHAMKALADEARAVYAG
jgi:2-methylisocitrate lyase-like PEP mutase family enzyme